MGVLVSVRERQGSGRVGRDVRISGLISGGRCRGTRDFRRVVSWRACLICCSAGRKLEAESVAVESSVEGRLAVVESFRGYSVV